MYTKKPSKGSISIMDQSSVIPIQRELLGNEIMPEEIQPTNLKVSQEEKKSNQYWMDLILKNDLQQGFKQAQSIGLIDTNGIERVIFCLLKHKGNFEKIIDELC